MPVKQGNGGAREQGRRIAIIAGEESGDQLAASLMRSLTHIDPSCSFIGIGGHRMESLGLRSFFPMAEIAINGLMAILVRLPRLLGLIRQSADRIIDEKPDALVIVDSPEFTHRVAKRVRQALPALPIINYVPPTVWAVRPWRASAMRRYIDLSLAILPFEPAEHMRLGGPPCRYVGHPVATLLADKAKAPAEAAAAPTLLVLPGSRRTEIARHMVPFGAAVARLSPPPARIIIPAVPHLENEIRAAAAAWCLPAEIVIGEEAKWRAFSSATAALAASGTVTLELALMRVPHVVGYRIEFIISLLKRFLTVHSIAMSNLVFGRRLMPEFLDQACTAENLAEALAPLLRDSDARKAQLAAFDRISAAMKVDDTAAAAKAVVDSIDKRVQL